MAGTAPKAGAAERQLKLALFIAVRGPVSRQQVQDSLPEYAPAPQEPGEAAAKRAAETARRRFERDKAELAAAGMQIATGPDGLYRMDAAGVAGPLSALEAGSPRSALLRVAGTALLQDQGCPSGRALRLALAKLSGPLEIPDTLAWAGEESLRSIAAPKPARGTIRRKVASALKHHKRLSFEYTDASGRSSKRCVEPIGVYSSKGREYLAAWDTQRADRRCFRLDRMSGASVSCNGRGKPDYKARPFVPEEWQLLGFQMGAGPAREALVRVSPSALWQARNLCAGYGELVKDSIGRVSWRVSYANARELAAWCVANGPGLVPAQPQEAAQAYAQIIEEARRWGSSQAAPADPPQERPLPPDELEALLWEEEGRAVSANQDALARFVEELTQAYLMPSAAAGVPEEPEPNLGEQDLMVSLLCLLEEAGRVSIPQASQLLGCSEEHVYNALESLAFCYDAVGLRLELGEQGCAFASLDQRSGLRPALTEQEARALASAAASLTERSTAGTLATACAQEQPQVLELSYWKEGASSPQVRVVEPHALLVQQGHTYLQAFCRLSQGQRLFRLDRILSARILAQEEAAFHAAAEGGPASWQRARIALAPGTRLPGWPGATLSKKQASSGNIGLSVPWYGGPWLPKQLASLGAQVQGIEPRELAWATCSYAEGLSAELQGSPPEG